MLPQESDVMAINVAQIVALPKPKLLGDRQTGNHLSRNAPFTEPIGVVEEGDTVEAGLSTAAVGGEDHRVNVDLAAVRGTQLRTYREPVDRKSEAQISEHGEHQVELVCVDGNVEIPVRATLPTNNRIHRPSATYPRPQPTITQDLEQRDHLIRLHRYPPLREIR
jgi:hypothetical protein